ncbi:MAG: DUF6036 family nucleotidyltransferase [Anaerolineae bacterium]
MDIWQRIRGSSDRLEGRLLFVGWLVEQLKPHNVRPIIVGGHALEFYTLGSYTTADIDLVCSEPDKIGQLLREAQFEQEGRHWFHSDLDLAVEIPGELLAGSLERVETVAIEEYTVYLIGKEDLLIDRLNACVFWQSQADCLWVKELILLYSDQLDWEYLERRAKEEGTQARLGELRAEVLKQADDD